MKINFCPSCENRIPGKAKQCTKYALTKRSTRSLLIATRSEGVDKATLQSEASISRKRSNTYSYADASVLRFYRNNEAYVRLRISI